MVSSRLRMMDSLTPAGAGSGPQAEPQARVCIPNIDTAGRRQRLMAGVVELVIGAGILGFLLAGHANPLWRLPLLLVFWGGTISFFQWRDHT